MKPTIIALVAIVAVAAVVAVVYIGMPLQQETPTGAFLNEGAALEELERQVEDQQFTEEDLQELLNLLGQ